MGAKGGGEEDIVTYCVTGATGYIGSWLVKCLLSKGYRVHATVRNPEKASRLFNLWEGRKRLKLFRADLQDEGSFDAAIRGCHGVYHVAASMEFHVPDLEDIESYVQRNVIDPAIRGTLNVLKSCLKTTSVKRVVFTSSISTLTAKDSSRKWIPVVDESCQTPVCEVLKNKASGWVYVLSKLLTEDAAFQFASENNIDLVSVITTTVAGPSLTSTVPGSIQVLLSPITGDPNMLSVLKAVSARMGSVALVHIEDICKAHMFVMEHAKAEGRYLCCIQSCLMSELLEHLLEAYPCFNLPRLVQEEHDSAPSEISSKKLRDLGFTCKYGVQDIINQTVHQSIDCGFIPAISNMEEIENSKCHNTTLGPQHSLSWGPSSEVMNT